MQARQKIKIDIAIGAVILLALVFLGFVPLLNTLLKNSKQITDKKSELKFLGEQTAILESFKDNSAAFSQGLEKIKSSFVSDESPVEFLEFVEKQAQESNLAVSIASVGDVSGKKASRLITAFHIALSGSFPDSLIFLKKLEQSPWLLRFDTVELNSDESKEAKAGQVVLNLGLETYSQYLGPGPSSEASTTISANQNAE